MSDTATLVRALRVLARDIHCEDGIAVQCITEAADAIERLRLTDEEREAIHMARSIMVVEHDLSVGDEFNGKQPRRSSGYWWGMVSALHSLLKRLGGPDE
jgi:hypothetical protein